MVMLLSSQTMVTCWVSIISIQQGVLYIDGSRPTDGPDKENLVIGFDLASGKITVYDSYIGTGRSFNVQ